MAIITPGKGRSRQRLLILGLIILAIIVGIYFYSTKTPAPTPQPIVPTEEGLVQAPEIAVPGALVKTPEAPKITLTPEALSSKKISEILANLKKLELVLHGKLPIEVGTQEVGRTAPDNPFIPVP